MQTACLLASEGMGPEQIAQMMAIDRVGAIKRLLKTKPARIKVAALRGEPMRLEIEHQRALRRMLPKSIEAIGDVFERGDVRETRQMAQWVHEAVIQKPAAKVEHKIEGRLEHDLSPLFQKMAEQMAALREANEKNDPLLRVELGSEKTVRMLPSGE